MSRLRWTPDLIAAAADAVVQTGSLEDAAALLSQRLGVPVNANALNTSLTRGGKPAQGLIAQYLRSRLQGAVPPPTVPPSAANRLPDSAPVAERGRGFLDQELTPDQEIRRSISEELADPVADVGRTRSIAVLADLHIPDEDKAAVAAALALIRERQPDEVILLGDVGEFESCSQHSPSLQRYSDDIAAVRGFLQRLRAAAPSATLTLCAGNHETRMHRTISAIMPTMAGAHRIENDLGLNALGVQYVPEDAQPIRRGNALLLHGHQVGKWLPKHAAARLADIYGASGGTVVCGHGHRGQWHERAMAGGNAIGVSLRCLRSLKPGWLHGQEAGWGLGMAWITVLNDDATVEPIQFRGGAMVFGGVGYRAAA